jgi:prepilin signal peptidase PulO-like enzyme (type II secretory pathway)
LKLIATIWWLGFWTALGLIVGSFLNVVVYRLPRRQSLRRPLWSACPNCSERIAWYDNLPILSFTLLRGRCRHCGSTIASRYLVIEAAMALIVLMLVDAFMIGHVRGGLRASDFGLTDSLAYDWPILLAHVILFACLLAMSAIDLEHYWVDIRFTNFVTAAGFVLHTIWTPRHSLEWPRPMDGTAIVCALALVGLVLTWVVVAAHEPFWRDESPPASDDSGQPNEAAELAIGGEPTARPRVPPIFSTSRAFGWLATLLLLGLFFSLVIDGGGLTGLPILDQPVRALVPALFFFLLIVSESTVARQSDHAIVEAIEEERYTARKMVTAELGLLLPAALFGLVGLMLMLSGGEMSQRLARGLHTTLALDRVELLRHWQPLYGFATAASGFIIAGAIGWAVRIVFTFAFGREAFGTGDIHLMAAAGCVAGWPVVVLGFFLTCGISLLGWLATLPFKRSRALPLGPWLSLAFLLVVIFYDSIVAWGPIRNAVTVVNWFVFQNSQPTRMIISP